MSEYETAKLTLVEPSNHALNEVSKAVNTEEVQSEFIQGLIDRMIELSEGKGHGNEDSRQMVGLSAVQLGVLKRVITIDLTADGSNREQTLQPIINPVLSEISEEKVDGREGCWSCANICGNVERCKSVKLSGLDAAGSPITFDLSDFVARIAQHEVDHLDGIRFPARIPLDQPERLHHVVPHEFDRYRNEWQSWDNLATREQWDAVQKI